MQWLWIVLAVLVLLWIVLRMQSRKGVATISSGELEARLKRDPQSLQIVDVREPYEFASGHISRAKNIPLGSIQRSFHEVSKDKELVFVCRSGNRSLRAAQLAKKAGFASVYNLSGGMGGWSGPVKKVRK